MLHKMCSALFGFMVWAQQTNVPSLGPAPQAKSGQEFDDWLELAESRDPKSTVRQATAFLARYPRSEFAARACQAQMIAYQQLDDYQGSVAAGKQALALDPGNLHVLATLANVIPNPGDGRAPTDAQLREAASYAQRVLDGVALQKIPRSLDLGEWQRIRLSLEVSARAALGWVALLRGQPREAIRELEWVTGRGGGKDGVQWLRLGAAYVSTIDNECQAARAYERAAALGPEPVRFRATEAIKRLGPNAAQCQFIAPDKLLSAPGTPPTPVRRSPGRQP